MLWIRVPIRIMEMGIEVPIWDARSLVRRYSDIFGGLVSVWGVGEEENVRRRVVITAVRARRNAIWWWREECG